MSDRELMIKGLTALIMVVGKEVGWTNEDVAKEQATLYIWEGIRDGRIADVTFNAATLARLIGRL